MLLVVVIIGGFACYMGLRSHIDKLNASPSAVEQQPPKDDDQTATAETPAEQPKKHSRKHRRLH